jgi:hypothetical protein
MREPSPKAVKVAQKSESVGLVDTIGAGVQSAYSAVGNAVPFLKPVTDIFGAMSKAGTGIVGKLLGFLGFCKPQLSTSGNTVLVRPTEYFGNANGIDHSHVLALDFMNNVDFYPGLGGTDCDEMSFDFLKKIPQCIAWFDYSKSTATDSTLFETWVSPSYFAPGYLSIRGRPTPNVETANDYIVMNELQPTVLNYISSSFMYWTGSLVYTFRFVKTDYHSGRVEISFHPMTNTTSIDRKDYVYKVVVDLRENTEVSVSVPYISPTAWKQLKAQDPLSRTAKWADYGPQCTGKLMVRAVTPLICNQIVADSIECLVEVRAGDDYKVQGPCRSGYFPFVPRKDNTVKQAARAGVPVRVDRHRERSRQRYAVQQSGPFALAGTSETRTSAIEGLIPESITRASADIHRVDTSGVCAGEEFSNLREIIKRFCFVEKIPATQTIYDGTGSGTVMPYFDTTKNIISRTPAYYLRSPYLTCSNYRATGQGGVANLFGFNQFALQKNVAPMSWASALYAFYRGGIRYKVYVPPALPTETVPNPGQTSIVSARLIDLDDAPDYDGWDEISQLPVNRRLCSYMAPAAYELLQHKGFGEFQTPFYSPVILSSAWDEQQVTPFDQSSQAIDFAFSQERKNIDVCIAVAAADDLTFHGFLGVPPVIGLGRINAYYPPPPGSGFSDKASYIDVTRMAVDPAYPLTTFSDQKSQWQAVSPGTSYYIFAGDLSVSMVLQQSPQFLRLKTAFKGFL